MGTNACPLTINYRDESYCVEMQWQKADSFKNGQYSTTTLDSPQLNLSNSKAPHWLYSRLTFKVWKSISTSHQAQEVPGLQFIPFMVMANGHHHSWNNAFELDTQTNTYTLWQLPFQQMDGCWQIHWIDSKKSKESNFLLSIDSFKNLSAADNAIIKQNCNLLSEALLKIEKN